MLWSLTRWKCKGLLYVWGISSLIFSINHFVNLSLKSGYRNTDDDNMHFLIRCSSNSSKSTSWEGTRSSRPACLCKWAFPCPCTTTPWSSLRRTPSLCPLLRCPRSLVKDNSRQTTAKFGILGKAQVHWEAQVHVSSAEVALKGVLPGHRPETHNHKELCSRGELNI